MKFTRRQLIAGASIGFAAALSVQRSWAQSILRPDQDRVFICNEDSNTLAVVDPNSNTVVQTVNLTSFDEDPRPPFRLVTGGVTYPPRNGQKTTLPRCNRHSRRRAISR
jgi:YVTN family beta-propeller protein